MAPQLAIPYAAVGAPFAGRMLEKWDKTLQSFAHIKVDTAEAAALQTTIKVGLVEIVKGCRYLSRVASTQKVPY